MMIYSDEYYEIRERIKGQYKDEIAHVKQSLDEENIIEIRTKIYESLRKDAELRQLVIREYEEKKDFLNFRILY